MKKPIRGSELPLHAQKEVLQRFVHRYTKDHIPNWARDTDYAVQFASDADWLANTCFYINADGSLDGRHRYCESHPTWPEGI